jgi:hypothetical protein
MPLTILSGNPTGSFEETQDSAVKIGNPEIFNMPAPASLSGTPQSPTAQQIINGIIVISNATTVTVNLPRAQQVGATPGLATLLRPFTSRGLIVGDIIYCTFVSGGAGALTLTDSADIIHDANTSQSVPAGTSRQVAFRVTNGTVGSEAFSYF